MKELNESSKKELTEVVEMDDLSPNASSAPFNDALQVCFGGNFVCLFCFLILFLPAHFGARKSHPMEEICNFCNYIFGPDYFCAVEGEKMAKGLPL